MNIETLFATLGWELTGEDDLRRFKGQMEGVRSSLTNFAAVAARAGVAMGAAAAAGAAALAKSVISVSAEFEGLKVQLEAIEGSSEKAETALSWIKTFAKDTPLDLQGTTKAYAQMRNFGLDPLNGSLQSLTDTMAMSGKGQEHLEGLILAVGQAWTKQKLQGEEIMQLVERGVPVWDLLSQATGKTTAELMKMSEQGKLGRKEIQLLIDAMGKRSAGASEKMAKTWSGTLGKLSATWDDFLLKIGDSGFFEWMKGRLGEISTFFEGLEADGTLDRWALNISKAFIAVGESMGRFGRLALKIGKLVVKNIKPIAIAAGLLMAAFFPLTTLLIGAMFALDDFLAYLEGGDSIIGRWVSKLPQLVDRLEDIAPGFGDAAESMRKAWLARDWKGLGTAVVQMIGSGLRGLASADNPISAYFKGIKDRLDEYGLETVFTRLREAWTGIFEGFERYATGVSDLATAIGRLFSSSEGGAKFADMMSGASEAVGRFAASAGIAFYEGLAGALKAVGIGFDGIGKTLTKLSEGDVMGALGAQWDGIKSQAENLKNTVEAMIQAFAPDFSFDAAWEKVRNGMTAFADWVDGWIARINGLFASIQWPEPPAWLKGFLGDISDRGEAYNRSRNAADAGAAVGAMVPPAANQNTPGRQAANQNELTQLLQSFVQHANRVSGDGATAAAVGTVENRYDYSRVIGDINAPVNIRVETNASPAAIGAAAGAGVRRAGQEIRGLAVSGGPGFGGPR